MGRTSGIAGAVLCWPLPWPMSARGAPSAPDAADEEVAGDLAHGEVAFDDTVRRSPGSEMERLH